MSEKQRYHEVANDQVRRPSIIRLTDYDQFRKEIKSHYPNITYKQISELWNFANDCWSDGYRRGKRGD